MTNLLAETLEDIASSGHTVADVVFIGSADGVYKMDWAKFEVLADVEYDSGFGSAEVATDLVVLFSDGKRMWRHEYDGSERWEWDPPLTVDYSKPGDVPERLVGRYWPSLSDLHSGDPHYV